MMAYRNGLYQGQVRQGSRQGQGILQLDEGPILVANWKHGLPIGKAFAFLNHQEYAYLSFYQGHLEGYCYFCSEKEMLVVQFANGGPVEQQLLVNFY